MITLDMKHYSALAHAEQFIYPAMKQNLEARHRTEIEKDLNLLKELKSFILQELYSPRIPFATDGRG